MAQASTTTWFKRVAITLIVVVVALPLLAWAALMTPPAKNWLKTFAIGAAEDSLNAKLTIGDVSGSLLGGVEVHNIKLVDLEDNPIAEVDSASASYGLLGALSGSLVVDELAVDGLRVYVRSDSDGTLNLTKLLKPTPESPPTEFRIILENIAVTKARVSWEDGTRGGRLAAYTLDEIDFGPSVANAANTALLHDLTLTARADVDLAGDASVVVEKFTADLGVSHTLRSRYTMNDVRFWMGSGDMSASWETTQVGDAVTISDLGLIWKENGELRASLNANLSPQLAPALTNVGLEYGPATTIQTRIFADGTIDDINVHALASTTDYGAIAVEGRLGDYDDPTRLNFDVWAKTTDFQPSEWVTGLDDMPTIKGTVALEAHGTGTDPDTMTANARIQVKQTTIDAYRIQSAFVRARLDAGELKVDTFDVDTPYARAAGDAGFNLDTGEFRVNLSAEGDDELARITGGAFKDNAELDGTLTAKGNLDLSAADPLSMVRALDLSTHWNLKDFQAEDISVASSRGDVKVKVGQTRVQGEDARRIDFDALVSARRVRAKSVRLNTLNLDSDGHVTVVPPLESLSALLNRLNIRFDGRVDGLVAPGVAVTSATAKGNVASAAGSRAYDYDIDANLQGIGLDDAVARAVDVDLKGRVAFDAKASPRSLSSKGTLNLDEVRAAGQHVGKADIVLDISGPTRRPKGEIQVEAHDTQLSGGYDFEHLEANVTVEDERRFVIKAVGRQPEDRLPRQIELEVTGSYTEGLDDFEIDDVRLTTSGSDWIIENGVAASPKDGSYRFRKLKLSHGDDQTVTIDGVLRPGKDQDLKVEIVGLQLEEIATEFGFAIPPVRAQIDGVIDVGGTAQEPTGVLDIILRDVYYEGYGPFEIALRGTYEDDNLYVTDMTVAAYGAPLVDATAIIPIHVTTTGEFAVREDGEFSMLARIIPVGLDRFYPALPALTDYSARGTISGDIAFFGRVAEPYVDARVELVDAEVSYPLSDGSDLAMGPVKVASTFRYEPPIMDAGGFEAEVALKDRSGEGLQARASAQIPLADWLQAIARGQFDSIQTSDWLESTFSFLVLLPSYDMSKVNVSAMREAKSEGRLDLYLSGDGTFGKPEATLRARLADFGWDRYRDIYVDVDARLNSDKLVLKNLAVEWDADDIFKASATIPVPLMALLGQENLADLPIAGDIELYTLPIAKLSAVDYTFAALKGTMDAKIKVGGRLSAPTLSAKANLTDVLFDNRKTGSLAFEVNAKSNRLITNALLTHGKQKSLSLSLTGPVNLDIISVIQGNPVLREGALSASLIANDLEVAGVIPARILRNVVTNLDGTLTSDIRMSGSWASPGFAGDLSLVNFKAFFPTFGRRIDESNLTLKAEKDRIRIVELHAREDKGYLDAEGEFTFDGIQPKTGTLDLSMKEFGTSGFTPLPTWVSGSARLQADLASDIVDAHVALKDLNIAIPQSRQTGAYDLDLNPDIEIMDPRTRKSGTIDVGEVDTSMGSRSRIARVQVEISPNSFVKHPNATIEFKGALALDVGTNDTVIYGDLTSIDGELEFLGKQFEMQQGIVTFAGNTPPNPRIQVEAAYILDRSISEAMGPATGGEPKAIVRVSGSARKPNLRMVSDPVMTESQIIYVLVSDRPPTTAESGEEEGVASQAVAAASGLLSGMLKQRAKQYYPIDTLRLKADSEGISGVEVGKYFGKSLFFAYEYQFAPEEGENTSEFRLEYRLDFAPSWLVGTRFGDQANGAVFIYWDIL